MHLPALACALSFTDDDAYALPYPRPPVSSTPLCRFWVDAPSSVPVELISLFIGDTGSLGLLRFLRMFRLLRLLK